MPAPASGVRRGSGIRPVHHPPEPSRCTGRGRSRARPAAAPRARAVVAATDRRASTRSRRRGRPGPRPGPAARSRPASTAVAIAATSLATTGRAQAIASRTTFGSPSRSPVGSTTDGTTTRSAAAYSPGSSACVRGPQSSIRPPRPAVEMRRSSASRSGPSPTIRSRNGSSTRAAASTSTSNPFFATSRPTASTVAGPGPARNLGGAEPLEVDAVRDQVNLLAALAELGDHVGVARDHARRLTGPPGELAGRELPRVARVDAEAVRDTEPARDLDRDVGGPMGEIGVDPANRASVEALEHRLGLLGGGARREHLDALEQRTRCRGGGRRRRPAWWRRRPPASRRARAPAAR